MTATMRRITPDGDFGLWVEVVDEEPPADGRVIELRSKRSSGEVRKREG